MGEGCRVVSSKLDDSSFKHNCMFLSRYENPIQPGSMAAFLTRGQSFPGAGGRRGLVAAQGLGWTDIQTLPWGPSRLRLNGPVSTQPLYGGVEDYLTLSPTAVMKSRGWALSKAKLTKLSFSRFKDMMSVATQM